MCAKIFISILISLANFNAIFGQSDFLSCEYFNDVEYGYTCVLKTNNPNGLNNFTDIFGDHLMFWEDEDVRMIGTRADGISTNIPSIICEKFPNLRFIFLSAIGIERVDNYSFSGCQKLLVLSLENNNITEVPEDAFSHNLELFVFGFFGEPLLTLPESLFENQKKLNILALEYNQFEDFPLKLFSPLKNLETLWLSSNKIRILRAEWFDSLENLLELDLGGNPIEELPANVFGGLKNLSLLFLQNANIKAIHSNSFGIHSNSLSIYLSYNPIFAVDERCFDNVTKNIDLSMRNTACANVAVSGVEQIKEALKQCFSNFENSFAICRRETETDIVLSTNQVDSHKYAVEKAIEADIKLEIEELREKVKMLMKRNEELQAKVSDLSAD